MHNRFDLYVLIHKSVRLALTDSLSAMDQTDFAEPSERTAALSRMREILGFLRQHAEHEDTHVLPFVRAFAPALVARNEADHMEQHALEAELALALEAVERSATVAAQRALRSVLNRWVAFSLKHMDFEETHINQALWDQCTDAEIQALQTQIERAMPPHEFAPFVAFMMPALSLRERAAFVGTIRQAAPPPVLELVVSTGRRVLGEQRWAQVHALALAA